MSVTLMITYDRPGATAIKPEDVPRMFPDDHIPVRMLMITMYHTPLYGTLVSYFRSIYCCTFQCSYCWRPHCCCGRQPYR